MYILGLVFASLASASLGIWLYLFFLRGTFWRIEPRLDVSEPPSGDAKGECPSVAVIVPARNEAELLPVTLPALLNQDYPGKFHIYLVDDRSTDGTSEAAIMAARECGKQDRLTVLRGADLPDGWRGKVWAMHQGVRAGESSRPEFILLTDADTAHEPGILRALVRKAQSDRLDLVSLMTILRVESTWDRLLIPSFVYFFAKLYPFRWVNDLRKHTAGANGGCILLRRGVLMKAGGFEAMRGVTIDDCALGSLIKRSGGRIWMGFTKDSRSLRRHRDLSTTWDMVARYAYTQLHHSPLLLAGTVLGMLMTYLVPPVAIVLGVVVAGLTDNLPLSLWVLSAGVASWALMFASYIPMTRLYGISHQYARLLPVSAALYTMMTVASAWRHWRGRGSAWKGRTYRTPIP
jgi:hopene-associated glycosyltransferase HpnB